MNILLASDQAMLCDGLQRSLLEYAETGSQVATASGWPGALAAIRNAASFSVVVVDIDIAGFSFRQAIAQLRECRPDLPLIAISSCADPQRMTDVLRGGAAGYVHKSASGRVLMGAIGLALAGSIYVPPELLRCQEPRALAPQSEVARLAAHAVSAHPELTRRQTDVLRLMAQGKPNKLISRELGIAPGTVKAHVTALMRALKVSNRTQAASAVFAGATPSSGLAHRAATYLN